MSLGPLDLTGGPFLALYGALLVVTIVAGIIIPRWLRPEGRSRRITDTDQLAYLAGGASRFADAVVTRLLAARELFMIGKDRFRTDSRAAGRTAAERSVLMLSAARWPAIEGALKRHAEPVERKLVAAGLLMDDALTLQMRFWQTSPYLLLLAFGAAKWIVGDLRDRPVGYLTGLLVATMVFALFRWCRVDRRTRGGHAALAAARSGSERLRRAPTAIETDLAVALFGTTVLVGSGWSDFHKLRAAGSGDGGGSSGCGDGGSGCGGGGCGGCGG